MVRIKHRYLTVELVPDSGTNEGFAKDFSTQDIFNSLREKIQELFGDVGYGLIAKNISLKIYFPDCGIFIVRVARDSEVELRFALCCLNKIKRYSLICRTVAISGSSRTCKDSLLRLFIIISEVELSKDISSIRRGVAVDDLESNANFLRDKISERKAIIESLEL